MILESFSQLAVQDQFSAGRTSTEITLIVLFFSSKGVGPKMPCLVQFTHIYTEPGLGGAKLNSELLVTSGLRSSM